MCTEFWLEDMKRRDHSGDLCIYGIIILEENRVGMCGLDCSISG
jgi:hypothetical protein